MRRQWRNTLVLAGVLLAVGVMAVLGIGVLTILTGQRGTAGATALTKQEVEQRTLAKAKEMGLQGAPTTLQVKRTTPAEVGGRFGQVLSPYGKMPQAPGESEAIPVWLAVVRGKFIYFDPGTLPDRDGVARPPADERDTLILVWWDKPVPEFPTVSLLLANDNPATHWLSPEALDLEVVPPANPTPLPWRTPASKP